MKVITRVRTSYIGDDPLSWATFDSTLHSYSRDKALWNLLSPDNVHLVGMEKALRRRDK